MVPRDTVPCCSTLFLPGAPCAGRAQQAQLRGRDASYFLILPNVTRMLSLAEMANPKANSQELPAWTAAANTSWVWAARTSQGNTGHGDVQLPCPLPHSSNGKSPAQPDGCISPSPWPAPGRELPCSPGCLLLP